MKGAHVVGTFVVIGSSRVSFNKIAVKSKERERSKTQSACIRLSVRMLALSSRPPGFCWLIAIDCMACCV